MSQQRLRVTFAKGPQLKYISHLDLALAWERALRRAGIPLAYSHGFNPQARLQLASGLPLGYTGSAELMDVMLTEAVSPEEFVTRVRPALPEGLSLVDAREVPLKSPSLQSALRRAEYRVTVETSLPGDELSSRINHLLDCDRLEQQRVRKRRVETFDLRPLVDELRLEAIGQGHAVLWMRLSAGQRGNARPDAILAALGLEDAYSQVERTKLLFEFDSK
ncbi:MAG: TIGR03936 family radical SAM-associated protein [Anaerolineae bacterium]|jgi:radical SAM-linked protein